MKIFLLLILLSGGMNFSFSILKAVAIDEGHELVAETEFEQQLQDLRDSSLPVVQTLQPFLRCAVGLNTYRPMSNAEGQRTAAYLQLCKSIEPSLADTGIIYPFHSFF